MLDLAVRAPQESNERLRAKAETLGEEASCFQTTSVALPLGLTAIEREKNCVQKSPLTAKLPHADRPFDIRRVERSIYAPESETAETASPPITSADQRR